MGQFLDYLASVFASKVEAPANKERSFHVTFADNSFTQVFSSNKSSNESDNLSQLTQSNKKIIYLYQTIGFVSFMVHLWMVTLPKIQLESFDLMEPEGWQLVTLNFVPFIVFVASISAMQVVNKPLLEDGFKLNSKNSTGLNLNQNDFIYSLKIIILLMAICQVSSIFANQFLWSAVMIVPLWCYQLTSRVAQLEYQRYTPSPRKQWVNLNMSRSPKAASPKKEQRARTPVKQNSDSNNAQAKATPRTRTKRAVKNIITGVSDTYHAFEQNVAHQLSQKIFNPLSPKLKMIE